MLLQFLDWLKPHLKDLWWKLLVVIATCLAMFLSVLLGYWSVATFGFGAIIVWVLVVVWFIIIVD